jgi:hypothetical protein
MLPRVSAAALLLLRNKKFLFYWFAMKLKYSITRKIISNLSEENTADSQHIVMRTSELINKKLLDI